MSLADVFAQCFKEALRTMGIHILIIEAENRFRKNLYQCLQAEGFTVDKVTLQDDVETIVAKEKIDLVLLGVDGLGREGLALIRPIKAISPLSKIIIINDLNHMDLSIEGMELGAFDDFLVPLDIASLARRIREATMQKDRDG
jgi:DNA-binding response OmpR family regulator